MNADTEDLPAPSPLQILPPAAHGARHDGWTRGKQAAFLRALASSHCVASAARSVGLSRQSAYKLRNRLRGEPFDIAWQCAFRRQYDALAEAALERALNGVEVPHYYKGQQVGSSRKFDERLTVALLALRERLTPVPPDRYAEQELFHPDSFEELVERVETGEELWAEEAGEGGVMGMAAEPALCWRSVTLPAI